MLHSLSKKHNFLREKLFFARTHCPDRRGGDCIKHIPCSVSFDIDTYALQCLHIYHPCTVKTVYRKTSVLFQQSCIGEQYAI
jgi:hypothetical protein